MLSASFDTSTLYETDRGHVAQAADGRVHVTFDDVQLAMSTEGLQQVHQKLHALSGSVSGCECSSGCRWQLRVPCTKHPVLVLNTDEMRALATLVGGAATMIELDDILNAAAIDWSA